MPIVGMAGDPSAIGDVPGRDLGFWGLGWLGHVGMWTGNSVLEVLDKTPVIQQNTLANFKAQTSYWGARYGNGSNFYTMTSTGWDQSNYNPSYTLTSQWREGKWVYKCTKYTASGTCASYGNVMTTALFRCDTFVNYMYFKGTGSNLVSSFTPANVYNAMPIAR
ncbi:MAG: hypothetical protein HOP02_13590 [Methylococcaceae bacterium]|nr:hypothetical protein [Methylococcaceae bacterium]